MTPHDLSLLREQLVPIVLGTIFSFVGLVSLAGAAIRRRREFLALLWFGCFIGIYGLHLLAEATLALSIVPGSLWPERLDVFVAYMLVVPYLLFWAELTVGRLRHLFWWSSAIGFVIGVVGLGFFAATGSPDTVLLLNSLLAIVMLIVVSVIVAIPKLSRRFLVVHSRVLTACLCAIAIAAVYYTSSSYLHFHPSRNLEPGAFALWVFAMGYVAAERSLANERRLFAIENELDMARRIQFSILPESVPLVTRLRLAAAYRPMSAVAGDFYQFIPIDEHRMGVLIADVAGHGVPAALISSMIKVAMQSVLGFADDPGEVLRSLNRTLSPELGGQLISAAYLWIDTQGSYARYSAAGHPPLLYWRSAQGDLEQIESNGLLFGVTPDSDYPVRTLPLQSCDRLLIYTDGVTEPENSTGEAFGESKLQGVLQDHRSLPASELLQQLLFELHNWQPPDAPQPDDITLILMDVG